MTPEVRNVYAGIYQTWAWQQGYNGCITRFRIPGYDPVGPLMALNSSEDDPSWQDFPFDPNEFFATVDLIDDGGIHYWRIEKPCDGERFIWLACTEDNSMDMVRTSDWFTAASWVHDPLKDRIN
jgi:hypothetical protein